MPQNYLPRPKKESVTTRVFWVILVLALSTGIFLFETWPARPRTWIGWGFTALLSGPLLALGEFVGETIFKHEPADPGRRVSIKRIVWCLGLVVSLTCVVFLLWRVQTQLLGDPLRRLLRLISPHFH